MLNICRILAVFYVTHIKDVQCHESPTMAIEIGRVLAQYHLSVAAFSCSEDGARLAAYVTD